MKEYKHLEAIEVDINHDELEQRARKYPYVIAHMYSNICCGEHVHDKIVWDELVELRAFDENGELHIYEQNGKLKAIEIKELEDSKNDNVVKCYTVRKSICNMSGHMVLKVKEYLEPDDDGQAVVVYTRPFRLEVKV